MGDTASTQHSTSGGCLCGAVRYEYSGEALFSAVCHCQSCQRQTGSAYSVVIGVPATAFQQQGATRSFTALGVSGKPVARHFCPDCGSPIISMVEALPDVVIIKAGTLDGGATLKPTIEVFCDTALPWLPAISGATRFAGSNLESDE
jgi:hypothetical protein